MAHEKEKFQNIELSIIPVIATTQLLKLVVDQLIQLNVAVSKLNKK